MNPHRHPKNAKTKHLQRLGREHNILCREQRALPPVELVTPYQSGWTRFFVLSERSLHRRDAPALERILGEINTERHCKNRGFTYSRRGRRGAFSMEFEGQGLSRIRAWRWEVLRWPADWLRYFHHIPHPIPRLSRYEFDRPELFEFKVVPHLITHVRQICPRIEQRLDEIDWELLPHGGMNRIAYLKGWPSGRQWLPPKSVQTERADESWQQQIRELRDEGVISQVLCLQGLQGFSDLVFVYLRTSSIEVMQRAFNARSRERYPGGPFITNMGDKH